VGGVGDLVGYARGSLIEEIESARRRILLVSPYITGGVAKEIAEAAERSHAGEMRLITELTERSVRSRVLAPEGLLRLRKAGFEVAHLDGLHAKVSVVDGWGLVGSGNLTDRGLGWEDKEKEPRGNVELGVVLSAPQVAAAIERMKHWRSTATKLTDAEIIRFKGLKAYPRPKTKLRKVDRTVGVIGTARLKETLEESAPPDRRYWLDPNYHDYADEGWWRRRGWVSDRREVGIKAGDLIVIYLTSKNRGPMKCPAVGRALGSADKREAFLRKERDAAAAKRWPWVTEIEIIGDVPADDGVGLEVIDTTGRSLQGGPREISREEFEKLVRELVS
jgi:hypothetical protein